MAEDLDANAVVFLIVDTRNPKKDTIRDRRPFNRLKGEILRYLSRSLPSLGIKTGHSDKRPVETSLHSASSLAVPLESMLSGSPVLFLDLRARPLIEAADRAQLISKAQEAYDELCKTHIANGVAETLDACTIAYFHDVLFGDGNPGTADLPLRSISDKKKSIVPLHAAIELVREGERFVSEDGRLAKASAEQVQDLSAWLAEHFFADAWQLLPDLAEREARDETHSALYSENIFALTLHIQRLWSHTNFHHLNVRDREGAKVLVNQLVKLDRLPKDNSLEGLLLLREAWCEYDVSMALAGGYKLVCKILYAVQLLFTWLVVLSSTLAVSSVPALDGSGGVLREVVFALTVVVACIVSIESFMNAKARWRRLRASAGSLHSIIWCYRTRVGQFELQPSQPEAESRPEVALRNTLNEWRDELVSGADLMLTQLEKRHPKHYFRHFQFEGCPAQAEADDFHSPMQPHRYITHRLEPLNHFYTRRIPVYARRLLVFKLLLLTCVGGSALLSRYGLVAWTTVVTAFSSALVTWSEFSDLSRKLERYTRLVRNLKKLLSWWCSLSEVEKASTQNIAVLVRTSEAVIAEEQSAWISTAGTAHSKEKGGEHQTSDATAAQAAAMGGGASGGSTGKARILPSAYEA